ncbi:MAG: DVUA0089 family protein [Rhodobacteraceae bacterium]|nr:DVUA0089 family protein [Paracoccaceae bacterium]
MKRSRFTSRHVRAALLSSVCAIVLAGPAAAQMRTGLCGQPGAITPVNVTVQPGATFETFLSPERGETRYVDITLSEPGRLTLRTEADGNLDPLLVLFDGSGAVLASDDDGAGGLDSLIEADLAAGSYCAQLRLFAAQVPEDGEGVYLSVSVAEGGAAVSGLPLDPAAACAAPGVAVVATPAPGGMPVSTARMVPPGGRDAVRLTLGFPMSLRIDSNSGEFDTVLMLLDDTGRVLAENDDYEGTDSRVERMLQPGQYCATVAAWSGSGGGNYRLTLSDSAVAAALDGPCADPALTEGVGQLVPGDGPITVGTILEGGGPRYVTLSTAATGPLRIDARSDAFDTVLRLYDATGRLVAENDDFQGTDSRIQEVLAAGDYCAEVTGFARSGDGPFTLELVALSEGSGTAASALPCTDPQRTSFLPSIGPGEGPISAQAVLLDDDGWFFEVDVLGTGRLVVDAESTAFDTMLTLYGMGGAMLAENDDFRGTDSRIDEVLPAATYCLGVTPFPGSGLGPVTLTATMGGEAGAGQGAAPAQAMATGRPQETWPSPDLETLAGGLPEGVAPRDLGLLGARPLSALVSGADAGWFAFTLADAADVSVAVSGPLGAVGLGLFEASGAEVGAALPDGTGMAELVLPLGPGAYVVGLTPLAGDDPLGMRQVTIRTE